MSLTLPARDSIALSIDNGIPEDYHLVRLYYSWYAGWFYRHRLRMVAGLLDSAHVDRILEVGVGSGIFIPEMLKRADQVVGIDIHQSYNGVRAMLEREKIDLNRVELRQGSIFEIPYPDASFDTVVCISVLEHFADPYPALREMKRVIKPGGALIFGVPAHTPITTFLFGVLGYKADSIHPGDHRAILKAAQNELAVEKVRRFPLGLFPMYVVCRARRQGS